MWRRVFALAMLLPWSASAQDISHVSVFDPDRRLVKTLESASELAAFGELWRGRTAQEGQLTGASLYAIVVIQRGSRRSYRWFYDPTGFTQVLSVLRVPVYRLSAPEAFNRLLGIGAL
jgi:hypothetical protein